MRSRRRRRGGRRGAWPRRRWAMAGPGRASIRRAEPHISDQAPPVWRAPEGPEGTGGLRDRPLRAAGSRVAISRAAGPNGAQNTSGAASNKLNREFRLHRRCEWRKRAWLRCLWAVAGPGRASRRRAPVPLVWRAPEGLAAAPVGGGGAWPGFEATRRAKLAARTARGRAAAHGHTKQPGPTAGPDGARNTSGATNSTGNQAISGSREPSGSPTRRRHPPARAGVPNRRRRARDPRPRR